MKNESAINEKYSSMILSTISNDSDTIDSEPMPHHGD